MQILNHPLPVKFVKIIISTSIQFNTKQLALETPCDDLAFPIVPGRLSDSKVKSDKGTHNNKTTKKIITTWKSYFKTPTLKQIRNCLI